MIDDTIRGSTRRLASSRIVDLERSLKTEFGNIAAELADRGMQRSTQRVTNTKSAAEHNLVQRAELIKNAIIEVCNSRNIGRSPNLGTALQSLFDEIYQPQVISVSAYVETSISDEAKKLCPIGELRPEIGMYRDDLALFAERLPPKDYWNNIVLWFRSRWWSVPLVVVVVCMPLLIQWVEMLKAILQWIGAIE
jgi:hypothetical protein